MVIFLFYRLPDSGFRCDIIINKSLFLVFRWIYDKLDYNTAVFCVLLGTRVYCPILVEKQARGKVRAILFDVGNRIRRFSYSRYFAEFFTYYAGLESVFGFESSMASCGACT